MTNGEWIIKTGKKFDDFHYKGDDYGGEAYIYYAGKRINTYNVNKAGFPCNIQMWFDMERKDCLTEDEIGFLHQLCSKFVPSGNGHQIVFRSPEKSIFETENYTEMCRTLVILDKGFNIPTSTPIAKIKLPSGKFEMVEDDYVYTPEELGIGDIDDSQH